MNSRLPYAGVTISDDDVRAMFEARAAQADDAGVWDAVLADIATTHQVGAWRRRLGVPVVQPPAGRAILVGIAVLTILAVIAVAVGSSRSRPALPPPGVILDRSIPLESPLPPTRVVRVLRVAFEYRLPPGIDYARFGSMIEWVGQAALSPPDAAEPPYALNVTRGIVAANADTAWSHGNGRVRLRSDPAGLLEDIRGRTGLPLPAVATTVDGRPALTASSDAPGNNDLHFSERMEGLVDADYIWFKFPVRLTLVDVDGTTLLFMAWGRTSADLAEWLPTADAFIDSIHFLGRDDASPTPDTSSP